jgi:2-oxo-hept-3-ene-1,7-dioate hydratase
VTLTDAQIAELAEEHETARQQVAPIGQPTQRYPDMTIADAYAVQRAWVGRQIADGARLVGHKIGLTSVAMQQAMGIDEPDYGALLDHMVFDDGSAIPADRWIDPKVEVELAFVLGERLEGADVTVFDVLEATRYVVPAVELIDARSHRVDPATGRRRTVRDTISDNAANAGIVTGGRPVRPLDVDLRWVGALLQRNGVIEESGVAAAVLNHPANGIAWLARRYADHGEALEAGQVILAGSFTRPVDVRAGDVVTVDYGPLGSLTVRFS